MINLDLAIQAIPQQLGAFIVKSPPAHVDGFDLHGRCAANGLIVGIANHKVVANYALERRERQHVRHLR